MSFLDDLGGDLTGGLSSLTNGVMGLIPGVTAGRQASGQYQAATAALIQRLESEWKLPDYDKTPLTPQEFKLLSNYAPQVAAFVQQAQPQLLRNVQGPGQQAQQQSLNDLQQLSSTGTDTGTKAAYELANLNADQAMRSNRANALNVLNQRGLGTSGATLGADIESGLGEAEQQRKASLQEAADASQRKAQAIQAMGNLGTQMRQQDTQQQQYNADTLNKYNELLANRRQQYNQYAADTGNQAQMYNQQMAQNTANQNTSLNNQYNMYNQQRADQMATNLANSSNQRLMGEAGLQGGANQEALNAQEQQAQNETSFFGNLAGIGLSKYLGSGTGGSGTPALSSPYADSGAMQAGGGSAFDGAASDAAIA